MRLDFKRMCGPLQETKVIFLQNGANTSEQLLTDIGLNSPHVSHIPAGKTSAKNPFHRRVSSRY